MTKWEILTIAEATVVEPLVLDSGGNPVGPSRYALRFLPTMQDQDKLTHMYVKGRSLYLGGVVASCHHGHHILELLTRWWPLVVHPEILDNIDNIVIGKLWYDSCHNQLETKTLANFRGGKSFDRDNISAKNWALHALKAFIPPSKFNMPIIFAFKPIKCETLMYPQTMLENLSTRIGVNERTAYQQKIMSQVYFKIRDYYHSVSKPNTIFEKIYITRSSGLKEKRIRSQQARETKSPLCTTWRFCNNEDKLEELLVERGFKIIIMEEYELADQIAILANAKIVLAAIGSSSHNFVFCNSSAKLLLLGDMHDPDLRNQGAQIFLDFLTGHNPRRIEATFTLVDRVGQMFDYNLHEVMERLDRAIDSYEQKPRVFYGRDSIWKDVTDIALSKCCIDRFLTIGPSDAERALLFGDPLPGQVKSLRITQNGHSYEYPAGISFAREVE